ncbi:hypothetical protein [Microbulbifer magnicolonia]|uniref:hypothetical protein n=1 Tax=Microbulbifer magnicolonia TaxID=3109744 RepID=UPI002B415602|nr:hypothetical protein [Microbulbifer sp. GG15]
MQRRLHTPAAAALAVALGLVHFHLLALLWGRLPQFNPLFGWMLANLAGSAWFYPLLWLHDLLISVLLSLPLALLIHWLRPRNWAPLLASALLPAFLYFNWPLIGDMRVQVLTAQQIAGWLSQIAMLPAALLLVHCLRHRQTGKGGD